MKTVKRLSSGSRTMILAGSAALLAGGIASASLSPALASSRTEGPVPSQTLWVSTHGTDVGNTCTNPANPCLTIAHAVAVAPSGATVKVEPGTYTNAASNGIDLFQPVTIEAVGNVAITGTGPIFNLYNADNPTAGVTGVTIAGFHFENVTGSSYNGVITVPGYGAGNVTVRNNRFTNNTQEAIGYHGNNGLAAPLGTGWKIVRNTILGVTQAGHSGIWLGGLSDSVISRNVVVDTQHAGIILTANGATPPSNNNDKIVQNRVRDVPYEGIQIAYGDGILVRSNVITDAGTAGTLPANPSASSTSAIMLFNAGQTNVMVIHNTASDSFNGFAVGQPPSSGSGTLGSGIVVTGNNFANETNAGIADYAPPGSAPLNAMLNWWGCKAGPGTAGCSTVIGSVDYTPWLKHPANVQLASGL